MLGVTILLIPILPILIIFMGVSSPEYVIYGTLNIDVSDSIPVWEVYTGFLGQILLLDFGNSLSSGKPVINELVIAFLESAKVIILALINSWIFGLLVLYLVRKYRFIFKLLTSIESLAYIPLIVHSYLILYFLDSLGVSIFSDVRYVFASLILSIYPIYILTRSVNSFIKKTLECDFYKFSKVCGFTDFEIWKKFGSKLIAIEVLSYFENIVIFLFGFVVFIELPFGILGMGYRLLSAIQRFDYPVIIGFSVLSIVVFSLIGLTTEFLRARLDPRHVIE